MLGEYIADRWIVAMLRSLASQRGISFSSWSDDWLIELRKQSQVHRVIGYRFDINDSVASNISKDKVATYTILEDRGIPTVPHVLVRTKVSHADGRSMKQWREIVLKPLDGTSGHGVQKFTNTNDAMRYVQEATIQAWAAAPFVDIRREVRIVMLDGAPLLVYEKYPVALGGLNMFNLGLGAKPIDIVPTDGLIDLARNAQSALGLRLSAVDIIEDAQGIMKVLEVNDAIMMEHYARVSEVNKKRAEEVYDAILSKLFD